jgi:hypothetical protein
LTNPYVTDPRYRALYDTLGSRTLTVPMSARTTRTGGRIWTETLSVMAMSLERPGVKKPDVEGDDTFNVKVVLKVKPESSQDDLASPNVGREITQNLRFNFPTLMRGVETGTLGGQAKMTEMAARTFKTLIVALGYDASEGMDPEAFVENEGPNVIGATVLGSVSQATNKEGELQDEIRTFFVEA